MKDLATFRIRLKDYVAPKLKKISTQFGMTSRAADRFEKKTNRSSKRVGNGFSKMNSVGRLLGARNGMAAFSASTRLSAAGMNPLIAGIGLAAIGAFKLGSILVKSSAELRKNLQVTNQLLGGTEQETKAITAQASALSKVYGADYTKTIQTASKLSQQFGISTSQSLELIKKGFASGADLSGEMLDSVEESASAFRRLGATGSQQMAILQQSVSKGIKDTPKLLESFSERLPNLGGDVKRLLDQNFGAGFSKQLKQNLASGETTAIEALRSISTAVGQVELTNGSAESLAEQIFGDRSDSAVQLLQNFAQFDTSLESLVQKNEQFNGSKNKQLKLQQKIAAEELKSSKRMAKLTDRFKVYGLKAKLILAENLEGILDFVDGIGKAIGWVSKITSYIGKIPLLGKAIKNSFKQLLNPLGAAYSLFEKFFGKSKEQQGSRTGAGQNIVSQDKNGVPVLNFMKQQKEDQETTDPILKNMLDESKNQTKTLNKLGDKQKSKGLFSTTDSTASERTTSRLTGGIDSIVAGGKQVRNVTMTIQRMIGAEVINTTVEESIDNLEQRLGDMLVRVMQGAEVSLNRG